jgi:hypothetical protein
MFRFAPQKDGSTPEAGARPLDPPSPKIARRRWTRQLVRWVFLVGLPVVLLPTLLPRKVSARRLAGAETASRASDVVSSPVPPEKTLQDIVDDFRSRLTIPSPVFVSIVPENKLVVSVERVKDRHDAFTMSIEARFLDGFSDSEIQALVAQELGHVWIFTHHPFLQTEELANEIAMRVVGRDVLESVYDKVWKRIGTKGSLVYLPAE